MSDPTLSDNYLKNELGADYPYGKLFGRKSVRRNPVFLPIGRVSLDSDV